MTTQSDPHTTARSTARRSNRRGEGRRLRDEILAVAMEMAESNGSREVTLRGIARQIGISAPAVYLHFADMDHLLAAVMHLGFERLTAATSAAVFDIADPSEELLARCKAYCHFALDHPHLYQLMFEVVLPPSLQAKPDATPGRRSFDNLLEAVRRCLDAGLAPAHDDPFRLASLIWTAEHGLVLARIARPSFPWAPIDVLITEMVKRMMGFGSHYG